jgi:fructose-bisphosphate aldolase class II
LDGSALPLGRQPGTHASGADTAHACCVVVKGELSYVLRMEGEDTEKHSGDVSIPPVEASGFVKRTGVDFLAVSVGICASASYWISDA